MSRDAPSAPKLKSEAESKDPNLRTATIERTQQSSRKNLAAAIPQIVMEM
jgi:hypothetical protein